MVSHEKLLGLAFAPPRARAIARRWPEARHVAISSLAAMRLTYLLPDLLQELKLILRANARRPLLSCAAIGTLALGIGINTAVFSIAYGVLKPFDYPRAEALVKLHRTYDTLKSSPNARLQALWNRLPLSVPDAIDLRESAHSLTSVGLFTESTVTYAGTDAGGDEPRELQVSRVDTDLFAVLAVEAQLGRVFERSEIDRRAPVVVLSHGFWSEAFGRDPGILGKTLQIDGESHSVIGIMPAGFRIAGRDNDRLWLPLRISEKELHTRDSWRYQTLARIEADTSLDLARLELDALATRIREAHPQTNEGTGFRLVPLRDHVVGENRTLLLLLMGAVTAVLLIACVNIAHLLLARAAHRRHELSVRSALGASRSRLIAALLSESLMLAAAGGAAGFFLARQAHTLLLAWIPADLPRTADITIDGHVVTFTVAASLVVGLLAGLLPALLNTRISAPDLATHRSRGGRHRWIHGSLIVAEVALTLVLTAAAGLLVTSFVRLTAINPGFQSRNVLVQEVRLPAWRYPTPAQRLAFIEQLLARWSRLPGVDASAMTSKLPLPGPSLVSGFRDPGEAAIEGQDWTEGRSAAITFVTPAYFRALGLSLLEGRAFESTDRQDSEPVVVVSRSLAEQIWPAGEAIGRSLLIRNDDAYTVVGVAEDVRQEGIGLEPGGILYLPWSQPWAGLSRQTVFAVLKVSSGSPNHAAVRKAAREIDPLLPLATATPMTELLGRSVSLPRSRTGLIGLFATLALALTLIGIFAVLSYTTSRQVHEIGIRSALGATASRIRTDLLSRCLGLTALGVAFGLVGTLAVFRLLRGWLFAIEPTDPWVLVGSVGLIIATALAGCAVPAYRASRIDPTEALRCD